MNEHGPIVGIDLGGTNMQIGVVDRTGTVVGQARDKTQADQGMEKVVGRLVAGIGKACADAGVAVEDLAGVGIGAPGAVDHVAGVVLEAVNLRWNDVPLGAILQERLGVPVAVDNDVNVAVYGEWKAGVGRGVDDLLGVWVGTGIGGALVLNGALYQGALLTAGEIGHTTLFPGAARGHRSLEQNCSRTSIVNRIVQLIAANEPSSLAPKARSGGAGKIKSKALAEAYGVGDALVCDIVDEAAELVGIAIANVVTLLSLQRVILGGGVTEAIGKPFVNRVKDSVDRHVFPDRCRVVQVVASTLEDDAGIIGAALLAAERLRVADVARA